MPRVLIPLSILAAEVFGFLAQVSVAGDVNVPWSVGYTSVCGVLLVFAAASLRHIVKLYEDRIRTLTADRDFWRDKAESEDSKHD